ncbi:MAG: hypothetical protein RJA22_1280 [Verrucomicrobiota bacterium]
MGRTENFTRQLDDNHRPGIQDGSKRTRSAASPESFRANTPATARVTAGDG